MKTVALCIPLLCAAAEGEPRDNFDTLVQSLQSRDPKARRAAAQSMARERDMARAMPWLERLVRDPDWLVREGVATGLGGRPWPQVDALAPGLVASLADWPAAGARTQEMNRARAAVVGALQIAGRKHAASAVPAVGRIAVDPAEPADVREAACSTLGAYDSQSGPALPYLEQAAAQAKEKVVQITCRRAAEIARQYAGK